MGNTACGEQVPCFTCCDDGKGSQARRMPRIERTLSTPGYEVEVAVSPLAGLKGAAGYHSSVLVQGEEYFFSPMGIIHSPRLTSHKKNPHMQRIFIGLSRYSGSDLVEFFDSHFPPGHYDLLRKNCNSFSDCALYFLCDQRLDYKFKSVERFGKMADDHAGIIQSISGGEYLPNLQAVNFDLEAVIREIDTERPCLDDVRHEKEAFQIPSATAPDGEVLQSDSSVFIQGDTSICSARSDLIDFRSISSARSALPGDDSGTAHAKSPGRSQIGSPSGPTDPLGITVNAPPSVWSNPKMPPPSPKAVEKKSQPLTWKELRKLPPVIRPKLDTDA